MKSIVSLPGALIILLLALHGCDNTKIAPSESVYEQDYKVLAINRRGMSFPDQDFSVFAIFPPANFIKVQVVETSKQKTEMPRLLDNLEIDVRYRAVADENGSINTTSDDKVNFWDFANELYAFILPDYDELGFDEGLRGRESISQKMPGVNNQAQTFNLYDIQSKEFTAGWVPVTPIDDDGKLNYFPRFRIDAQSKQSRKILASTDIILPVAKPMDCAACHATGAIAASEEVSQRFFNRLSWSDNPDIDNQGKENVIFLHQAKYGRILTSRFPLMCAECHYSPVADPDGNGPLSTQQKRRLSLSISIHAAHALTNRESLPRNNEEQNIPENGNASCMNCHGRDAPYVRDAMGKVGLTCQDCHGGMLAIAKSPMVGAEVTRRPFLDEPRCESCHTGDALEHMGNDLILVKAYEETDVFATPRLANNKRFAEEPGKLFRQSVGHGGVGCQGCHGSPHALWSSNDATMVDNIIPAQLQGHGGSLIECVACHQDGVEVSLNGPHGLHNINDPEWMNEHGSFYQREPIATCQACHGLNLEGMYLSRVLADRDFKNQNGQKVFYKLGKFVGCGDCHENPALSSSFSNISNF